MATTPGKLADESAKDYRERVHIEEFIRHWPTLAGATLNRTLRPDFIVSRSVQRIGIEHTELFRDAGTPHGSALRATERAEDRVARFACQQYEKAGHPAVHVTFHWQYHRPVTPGRVKPLASEIAMFVARHVPAVGETMFVCLSHPLWEELPRELDAIHVGRFGDGARNFWASTRGTAVPKLTVGDVERAIMRKEPRIPAYRTVCDELWLLLVMDGFSPAGYFAVGDTVRRHTFITSADDVFLFEYFDRRITRLRKANRTR